MAKNGLPPVLATSADASSPWAASGFVRRMSSSMSAAVSPVGEAARCQRVVPRRHRIDLVRHLRCLVGTRATDDHSRAQSSAASASRPSVSGSSQWASSTRRANGLARCA